MNRSELHREQKAQKKQTKTFVLTQSQINDIKKQAFDEATEKLADTAFLLMLAVPLEVLITEDYWMKSAKKRLPKFIDEVLRVYKGYSEGMISLEEMESDLWEFAGIKCLRDKK